MSSESNQKNLLCKKMNLQCCDESCKRSHSKDELIMVQCHYGINCNNVKCLFLHPNDIVTKDEYYQKMYNYISPYETDFTTICRYSDIGCKIERCRKAHSINELKISDCDCYRDNCTFYHKERDFNITTEEYYTRMKNSIITLNKTNKTKLCRYINIGCQRDDCPYAHSIRELKVKHCLFNNCTSNCVFLHINETIDKQEYFERMLKHISPLKPKTVICHYKNCKDSNCKFAHSYDRLIISNCIRNNKCKKHCCPFRHPNENFNKDIYYKRMLHSLHPN
jgi:hypothetical protein